MEVLYNVLIFLHVMGFVFMSTPLFNLIVVNERALLGPSFNYYADRYMENIIRHGAIRCYVFQFTVLISGVFLVIFGPVGIEALWTSWIVLAKTLILFTMMGLLSYVHFGLQPKIESLVLKIGPEDAVPDGLSAQLKPYRVRRKRLATFCLFLVITAIILGLQVYSSFGSILTIVLIGIGALFAWKANKTLIRFGWI
ncbi:MAG: hypothetical protein E3J44_05335 [Candidatus Aminicenantes bacterium]|nr:MAG: hypothetical protein E3J44_05335 [Candidatus Aminicenantes bacterium]